MWVRVRNELHCYQLLRFAGHLSLRHKLGDLDWYKQDDKKKEGPQWPGQVWVCKRKAVLVSSFMTGRLCVATQRKHTVIFWDSPHPNPSKSDGPENTVSRIWHRALPLGDHQGDLMNQNRTEKRWVYLIPTHTHTPLWSPSPELWISRFTIPLASFFL